MKEEIVKALQRVTGESEIHLETPEREGFGDYSSNVAMKLKAEDSPVQTDSKLKEKKSSRDVAEDIVGKLRKDKELSKIVERIEVAGMGFINFWLKKDVLVDNLIQIDNKKDSFGKSTDLDGKKVIVEYSSPNIAKPFTIGHLRSTVIGDAIANLLEAVGWKVYRDNHLGDWGTQFGKQIYAIKTWGQKDKEDYTVKELVDLYVRFHEEAEKDLSLEEEGRKWFKKLEEGDFEARNIWKKCIDSSWKEFNKIYEKLGVVFSKEFDDGKGLGESFFESKMGVVITELQEKGLLKEGEEGAKLVFFENDKYPPAMILKKDGATLYHTRDLATDKYRKDTYNPNLIINEVGMEQSLYFKQLFEMEKILGWYKDGQRVHIGHGLFRFKDKKMSTRRGNVIWMEDILRLARDKARNIRNREIGISEITDLDISPEKAGYLPIDDTVSIGAIKWNDLKRDYKTEIVFDWAEILNMNGNSGPYLQYTYARTQSVLRKFKTQISKLKSTTKNSKSKKFLDLSYGFDISALTFEFNEEELKILRILVHFPEVVAEAAKNYSPNLLCNYLYDLAQKFNLFYSKHRILDGGTEKLKNLKTEKQFRLELTLATGQILKNGLKLLGIDAPEKM